MLDILLRVVFTITWLYSLLICQTNKYLLIIPTIFFRIQPNNRVQVIFKLAKCFAHKFYEWKLFYIFAMRDLITVEIQIPTPHCHFHSYIETLKSRKTKQFLNNSRTCVRQNSSTHQDYQHMYTCEVEKVKTIFSQPINMIMKFRQTNTVYVL